MRKVERSVSNKVTFSLACIHGQVTKHTTVKWPIDLRENETACRTYFHKKGFALSLVLKQRHIRELGNGLFQRRPLF